MNNNFKDDLWEALFMLPLTIVMFVSAFALVYGVWWVAETFLGMFF